MSRFQQMYRDQVVPNLMKQFSYDLEDLRNLPVYKKASALINEECDYWADRSFWDLYDEAQLAVN